MTSKPVRCPRCTSTVVRRSHRRGIERLVSVLALYPFRCEDCGIRFMRLAFAAKGAWRFHTGGSYFRLRPLRAVSSGAHALLVLLTGQ
jgi:predicted Zn-ribbon and HTH transcriptional regulator